MQAREHWGSSAGFIMACIGSAIGLGNIWRFPYIVGENGGGAFLVPYVIITICFGFAFMMLEFAVGKHYQTSVISSIGKIKSKLKGAGIFIVLVSFVILTYYLVVLGWIFAFFIMMISGLTVSFEEFTNSHYPIISFFVVLAFNYVIMIKGVSRGIENLNKIGIILLVALLVPLTIYGMSLSGSEKGLEYYLTPDFSKLSEPSIWSTAFGQVFFSLSLGSGILLTYGSYIKGGLSLLKSSSIIIVSNAMVSFVAGLMIFSFIFSFGMQPEAGVALIFEILPTIFASMEYGTIIGIVFFFLLLIAGLTSSVSLFQVQVSSFEDTVRFSKRKSVTLVTLLIAIVGTLSALSYSSYQFQLFETPFLDLMDTYFGTFGLSIASIVLITIITWYMDKKKIIEQFNQNSTIKFPPVIIDITKYVLPGIVIVSILFTALNL